MALGAQFFGQLFGASAAQAVHNSRLAGVPGQKVKDALQPFQAWKNR